MIHFISIRNIYTQLGPRWTNDLGHWTDEQLVEIGRHFVNLPMAANEVVCYDKNEEPILYTRSLGDLRGFLLQNGSLVSKSQLRRDALELRKKIRNSLEEDEPILLKVRLLNLEREFENAGEMGLIQTRSVIRILKKYVLEKNHES